MVFQNFALMPWLTVLQNVELGLEAQGIPREERQHRAVEAIDIIGLDGFESAYPKELSGGMRQRVGFARALVVNPDVLVMDLSMAGIGGLEASKKILSREFLTLRLLDVQRFLHQHLVFFHPARKSGVTGRKISDRNGARQIHQGNCLYSGKYRNE